LVSCDIIIFVTLFAVTCAWSTSKNGRPQRSCGESYTAGSVIRRDRLTRPGTLPCTLFARDALGRTTRAEQPSQQFSFLCLLNPCGTSALALKSSHSATRLACQLCAKMPSYGNETFVSWADLICRFAHDLTAHAIRSALYQFSHCARVLQMWVLEADKIANDRQRHTFVERRIVNGIKIAE
jgi:hypothetical protein